MVWFEDKSGEDLALLCQGQGYPPPMFSTKLVVGQRQEWVKLLQALARAGSPRGIQSVDRKHDRYHIG
nr:unnamed protein product [Callosobruchus chinensis]